MSDRIKIKYWWDTDKKWFCIIANDGVNEATVSLTPEEASLLSMNAVIDDPAATPAVGERNDLLDLAAQIERAQVLYLNQFGTPNVAPLRDAFAQLLWDNKGTFAAALRAAAQPASPLRGRDDPAPEPCSYFSIGELMEWLYNPQFTNGSLDSEAVNHITAAAELLEKFLAVSASPPEQPASDPRPWVEGEPRTMKMLLDKETFARQVEADPDLDCEAGGIGPLTVKNLLEEADQYRHPDFDSDCEKLVVRLADALLSASLPEPRRASSEPVWPNNDEANDLDKGDDA